MKQGIRTRWQHSPVWLPLNGGAELKRLLFSLALFIGFCGVSHAGGRQGAGWYVTVVTGTHKVVFEGKGFVKSISLSSGATANFGDYILGYSTAPFAALNGADGASLGFGGSLFSSTAQVIPSLVYKTTTTISGQGDVLTTQWKVGDAPNDFIEVPALIIRQNQTSTGEANKATILWSR